MSNFIDLDSLFRDRWIYPNPADYQVTPEQIETWFNNPRSVRAYPQNPVQRPVDFVSTVSLHFLTLPYDDSLADLPRLYIDFYCNTYKDIHILSTIGGRHPTARFVCVQDRIQVDSQGIPKWIHYRSSMHQTLRIKHKDTIVFKITDRLDQPLTQFIDTTPAVPPDPSRQIMATFEILSYIRDGEYSHHQIEPIDNF